MSDAIQPAVPLPEDLEKIRQSYIDMFGHMPPLPAAKFAASGRLAPDFLRSVEDVRAKAFYNTRFDMRHTQLILFGMLLAQGNGAASHHANAARRAGATWEQLHTIVELATAVGALAPSNNGGNILNTMLRDEAKS